MPGTSHLLFGVRNLTLIALCLLLVNAVLASLFGVASLTYPADAATSLALWIAVVVGSYVTVRNLPRMEKAWLFGGVTGAVFGVVVGIAMALVQSLNNGFSADSLLAFVVLVVFFVVLGLAGAGAGGASIVRMPGTTYSSRS